MKIALVVPGGVDRTGEFRVIPVLLALIERLARDHEVHVFALRQEATADCWELVGARIHNIGDGWSRLRAIKAIMAEHRRSPFDLVHAIFPVHAASSPSRRPRCFACPAWFISRAANSSRYAISVTADGRNGGDAFARRWCSVVRT